MCVCNDSSQLATGFPSFFLPSSLSSLLSFFPPFFLFSHNTQENFCHVFSGAGTRLVDHLSKGLLISNPLDYWHACLRYLFVLLVWVDDLMDLRRWSS